MKNTPLISRIIPNLLTHSPESPVFNTLWTEILLLSHFRRIDWAYLYDLNINPANNQFLHVLSRFHIYESQKRNGYIWLGGLSGYPISLSQELSSRMIPESSIGIKDIYQHFDKFINGESEYTHFI